MSGTLRDRTGDKMVQFNSRIVDKRELRTAERMGIPIGSDDSVPIDPLKQKVRRYVQLEKERRELEARLALIEDEERPLKEQIAEAFEESGTQRERVDGLTVYLAYKTYARPKDGDMQRLCDALRNCGMDDLVRDNVNINSLSAVVREKLKEALENDTPDDQILPRPVMDAMAISTTRHLQSMTGQTPRSKGQKEGDS